MGEATHFDDQGRARMVDVGAKSVSARRAVATGEVHVSAETLRRIRTGDIPKGDCFAVARLAGIMAAKKTSELVPLCHPIHLTDVEVEIEADEAAGVLRLRAETRALDRTGVEMEAMTAAAVAGLTLYDMLKGVERGIEIGPIRLALKEGGKSGTWTREGEGGA